MTEACARTLSRTRSVALQSLPDRCAREIPTLRYFVLSDDGPTNHQIEWDEREFRPLDVKIAAEERRDEEMGAFQDAEDRVDAGGDELEDELRLDECRAYRRTLEEGGRKETLQAWRVVRDGDDGGEGGGCRLVALPYREGKRLHETLVASFDERNPPLSGEYVCLLPMCCAQLRWAYSRVESRQPLLLNEVSRHRLVRADSYRFACSHDIHFHCQSFPPLRVLIQR